MSDLGDLKAWCHWKRKEKDLSEDNALFVKAIEDLVSLEGTLRAQLTAMTKERDESRVMERNEFLKLYYKAWNFATDKVGSDQRCWGDLLADKFCELLRLTSAPSKGRPSD